MLRIHRQGAGCLLPIQTLQKVIWVPFLPSKQLETAIMEYGYVLNTDI